MLCLQGGGEFSDGCREMDGQVLAYAGGPVAVLALAAAQGNQYDRAHGNGVGYYRSLGAEVLDLPDPREYDAKALLREARVIVLPGGSPERLLADLVASGIDAILQALLDDGGVISGASAGAMVLGRWTVLPETGPRLAPGLGLAGDLVVVPHWHGERDDWLGVIGAGTVLGIPEESGVLVQGQTLTAVGRRATRLVRAGADLGVGDSIVVDAVECSGSSSMSSGIEQLDQRTEGTA